jgi:hypothetical protein
MKTTTHLGPPEKAQSFSRRALLSLALAAVLALGFGLYSQPEVVIMLSEQLWACF